MPYTFWDGVTGASADVVSSATPLGAVKSGSVQINEDGTLLAAGESIQPDEFELRIIAEEGHACISDAGLFACLDIQLDHELELEGLARDVIRIVQNARREAGLVPDDRIVLGLKLEGDLRKAVEKHSDLIKSEVLATELAFGDISGTVYSETVDIQEHPMDVLIGKV